MDDKSSKDHGRDIGNIVRSAFKSGDLSRLSELGGTIGPAVDSVMKDVSGAVKDAGKVVKTELDNVASQLDGTVKNGGKNNAKNARQGGAPVPPPMVYKANVPAKKQALPGSTRGYGAIGFGVLGLVFFGLGGGVVALVGSVSGGFLTALATTTLGIVCGAGALLSAAGIGVGMGRRRLVKRIWKYYELFEKKQVYTFDELVKITGRSPRKIKRDMYKAQKMGMLKDVCMDAGETCIIKGADAYRMYVESEEARALREAEEERARQRLEDPETAPIERFKQEGAETRRKIREVNAALPDDEVTEKLDRLENITTRIFEFVEQNPDKLPETRRFMDYYLPTTLKLVEKYHEYDEIEIQPQNVQQVKKDILSTLNTINIAFDNMLEGLYQPDTLDVATDITVLEKMLEQEGLTPRHFKVDGAQDVAFRPIDEE